MLLSCVQEDELELNRVEARIVELSSATDLTQQEQPEQEVPEHEWAAEQSDVLEQELSEQHEPDSEQQLLTAISWEDAFSPVPQPPQCALAVKVAAKREIVISRVFIIKFTV